LKSAARGFTAGCQGEDSTNDLSHRADVRFVTSVVCNLYHPISVEADYR
jgi:hypothetical protein